MLLKPVSELVLSVSMSISGLVGLWCWGCCCSCCTCRILVDSSFFVLALGHRRAHLGMLLKIYVRVGVVVAAVVCLLLVCVVAFVVGVGVGRLL